MGQLAAANHLGKAFAVVEQGPINAVTPQLIDRRAHVGEAVELAKGLSVTDFVVPAKGADRTFNDYKDFEIYGLFVEGE